MKKSSALNAVNLQFERLAQIIEQQDEFNRNFILGAINTRMSHSSLISDQKDLTQFSSSRNYQQSQLSARSVDLRNEADQMRLSDLYTKDRDNNIGKQDGRDSNLMDFQGLRFSQKACEKQALHQQFVEEMQRRLAHSDHPSELTDINQNSTTKSITIPADERLVSPPPRQQYQDSDIKQSEFEDSPTVLMSNRNNMGHNLYGRRLDEARNLRLRVLYDSSSGPTETQCLNGELLTENDTIKQSSTHATLKENNKEQIKGKLFASNEKSRSMLKNNKNQKNKMQPLCLKSCNKQAPNSFVAQQLNGLDKNELQKVREKCYASVDKKQSGRKTGRNLGLPKTPSKPSLKYEKKTYQQQSSSQNMKNNKNSSSKGWMKSIEKSNKKVSKVNFTKVQPNKPSKNTKKSANITLKNLSQINKNKSSGNKLLQNSSGQFFNKPDNEEEYHSIHKRSSLNKKNPAETQNPQKDCKKNQNLTKNRHIVQKLDFEKKVHIMERILESKNIFKSYNLMVKNYQEAALKMNAKYFKQLQRQVKQESDQSVFKLKMLQAIVLFFCQFFVPSKKTVTGLLAKINEQQQEQIEMHKILNYLPKKQKKRQVVKNEENDAKKSIHQHNSMLVLSLLSSAKELVKIIQTFPVHLYNCNVLSQFSVDNVLETYEKINEQLDKQLSLQFFLIKKTKLFGYFHEMVEFVKFLQANDLIEKTERRNLNRTKKSMVGYYSSRSRREQIQTSQKPQIKLEKESFNKKKGCDSERKLTAYDGQTQRLREVELFIKSTAGKNRKNINKSGIQRLNKANPSAEKDRNF